jgi:DNA-binding NtrC family response regulator
VFSLWTKTAVRDACREIAGEQGFLSHGVASVAAARELLRGNSIDIIVLDLKGPDALGLELLNEIKTLHPETAIIVMTASATVTSAVEAMRTGAADYLTKPLALDELTIVLERASERQTLGSGQPAAARETAYPARAGKHHWAQRGDGQDLSHSLEGRLHCAPVLILGESGTGKEMVARAIHSNGPNAAKPFIPVDWQFTRSYAGGKRVVWLCQGAFTGAVRSKEGLLVSAEGGTVFLDEIGELPLDLQAKLLRALQEKEVRPVGATHRVPINVRILAATNCNLTEMVE